MGNAKLKLYDDMVEGAKSHIKVGSGLWWKLLKTLLRVLSNVCINIDAKIYVKPPSFATRFYYHTINCKINLKTTCLFFYAQK